MPKIGAFIHGVYPRSKDLSQTSRDVDRKRLGLSDLEKQAKKDFSELVKQQKNAGFDFLEDGKLSWQDIFRPLVEATSGMEVGPLTRWFDNNTFYRQPIIKGRLKLNTKKLDKFFLKSIDRKWKVTLSSPFTFAKLSSDTTTKSFEKTLVAITEIYIDLLSYLFSKKISFVQFDEPYIPYHKIKKTDISLLKKSLETIKTSLRAVAKQSYEDRHVVPLSGTPRDDALKISLHGYFGDTTELVKVFADSESIDVLGIDFTRTLLSSLPKKLEHDIIAGVVDGRSSLIEEKSMLKSFVEKALKYFGDKTIYLSNNSDLDLLPETVAKEKIKLLGEIRKEFS